MRLFLFLLIACRPQPVIVCVWPEPEPCAKVAWEPMLERFVQLELAPTIAREWPHAVIASPVVVEGRVVDGPHVGEAHTHATKRLPSTGAAAVLTTRLTMVDQRYDRWYRFHYSLAVDGHEVWRSEKPFVCLSARRND